MKGKFFLTTVVACLFFVAAAFGQNDFKIDEAATKSFIKGETLENNLIIENKSATFAADVKVEILDADERILSEKSSRENIKRGRQTILLPLSFAVSEDSNEYLWYRLRYTIKPINAPEKSSSGLISLSEIMPEIFEIRAVSGRSISPGTNFRVRVNCFQPISLKPLAQVKVKGEVTIELETESDEDELKIQAAAKTDREGYATLDFKIPPNVKIDDVEVKITGENNGIVREATDDLDVLEAGYAVYLNTDKPLYQPTQKLSVRGLYMQQNQFGQQRKIIADKELEFVVKDEDDTVLYRETVKTSRFGIAAFDWQIPENAKLGNYRVQVEADEELFIDQIYFKVSRYDLPNFTVSAKPEKTFYLPAETTAEITVGADYLFGKPVAKGTVKVVQEKMREWNYNEQKWEIEEEQIFTGETNAEGKFVTRVDLTKAHENLKDEDYRRFEDLSFTAYFTDATTNRTEQKRFDVRVSRDAIHVYLVGLRSGDYHPKMPIQFYVSTSYADGSPAECQIQITGKYEEEDEKNWRTLAAVKTNNLGVSQVELPLLKPNADDDFDDLQIKVAAFDEKNQTGKQEEEINLDADEKQIRLSTDKAIYKKGEPLKITVVSTETDRDAFVEISQNDSSIVTRVVHLKNNRAEVKIPFNPAFAGKLTAAAYFKDDEVDETVEFSRGIVYPKSSNLQLGAKFAQADYRPGEEAKVNFSVAARGKKASRETALGVMIFDRAIEERALTDAAFGSVRIEQFGGYGELLDSNFDLLDTSKTISDELQLKAEVELSQAYFYANFFESREYETNLKSVFAAHFNRQFSPVETVLKTQYAANFEHPRDDESLDKILSENQIDFKNLRDPWGNSYKAFFTTEREFDVLTVRSAGANKSFGNADDIEVLKLNFKYFTPTGEAVTRAVADYYKTTGKFIRDLETLAIELKKQNIELETLRDRWNKPYRIEFKTSGRFYKIDFMSGGDDGIYDYSYNDFYIWTTTIDYFEETEKRIEAILANYARETKTFPKDELEFRRILKNNQIDFDELRDGWNRPLKIKLQTFTRYSDRAKVESISKYGEPKQEKLVIAPVTQQVAVYRLHSAGENGNFEDYDDVVLANFSGIIYEQNKADAKPVEIKTETIFTGGKGAVRGTIVDPQGAVVPNAQVTATNEETKVEITTVSDSEGVYLLKNLPSGKYLIKVESPGFMAAVVENVPVRSSNLTEINFTLMVAGASSTVEVTVAADNVVNTTNSSISTTIKEFKTIPNSGVREEKSTPRLREYFPETIVWQPELLTDKKGKAELKFKLGDNITTWKMYAIASNAEGQIGVTSQELKSFQPFFADLEPPKFLTVGDEIYLPVQIRNYTEKAQTVDVKMAGGDWFNFLDAADKRIEVSAGNSSNAVFGFRADKIIKEGKQRVTALAGKDSDAIEKSVAVKPNGKEIVATKAEIFRDSAAFDVNFPANALAATQKAQLKIYPNLLAHVAESIEGLLQRPYGCGEQTVSSTYPNLMILKFAPKDSKIYAQGEKYLRKGYERLLGYQTENGGFAVWTKDAPDVALTAYALRFLVDAKDFIEVDEKVIERAEQWLIKQQRADGSWTRQYYGEQFEDKRRTKLITTYVARTLAMIGKDYEKTDKPAAALQKSLEYLKTRNAEIDEPYALALYGLASLDAKNFEDAKAVAAKLESMAISENSIVYWNLETNTPFYGWGTAGRIETTALVVHLLTRIQNLESKVQSQSESEISNLKSKIEEQRTKDKGQTTNLISKGTQFLLKNKDRYGVWYSTQTTINVLDAFLAAIGDVKAVGNEPRTAEIFVNNQKLKDIKLSPENGLSFPTDVELPISANQNRVEVKIAGENQSALMAQIVQTHYLGWNDFAANERNENQSRALRLAYNCDRQNAKPTEEITCRVEAERVGFQGYGMLLAEIGLPPGADVDRASLEKAKAENWSFSGYDVLPDKIIVYFWAQAGGTKFDFKFKPRYGINAQTAPSIVYDYYNSEAQATVAPLKFTVK